MIPDSAMAHEPELLDIAQAAAFLHVSQMSLRRWTNSGRLPCFRVGGRRERRFRRADLLALLERSDEPTRATQVLGHLCGLYTSVAARERRAAAFLAEGLEAGGTCFLAAEPTVREGVLARVARDWPTARAGARSERLVVGQYARSPAAQLEYWEAGFANATRAGARELRVAGDVSGGRLGRRRSFGDVLVYERGYDALSRRFGVATLCLYDARRLSGVEASRVLQVHPDMLRHPAGTLVS
jgi:transcriptional repressor of dcmA and dcmR